MIFNITFLDNIHVIFTESDRKFNKIKTSIRIQSCLDKNQLYI